MKRCLVPTSSAPDIYNHRISHCQCQLCFFLRTKVFVVSTNHIKMLLSSILFRLFHANTISVMLYNEIPNSRSSWIVWIFRIRSDLTLSRFRDFVSRPWLSGVLWKFISTSGHSDSQGWASECPDVKSYKWRLNPVWHRMLYSCTHAATVGVRGLRSRC